MSLTSSSLPSLSIDVNRYYSIAGLNSRNSLPCNHDQRHGRLVFDGQGGHGFHGQHLGHAVCHIHLGNTDSVVKLCVTGKKNQVYLEIDFRNGFARIEGFPDAPKVSASLMKPTGLSR